MNLKHLLIIITALVLMSFYIRTKQSINSNNIHKTIQLSNDNGNYTYSFESSKVQKKFLKRFLMSVNGGQVFMEKI